MKVCAKPDFGLPNQNHFEDMMEISKMYSVDENGEPHVREK